MIPSTGPAWAAPRAAWTLEPGLVFLNHGSFGACPRAVLEQQAAYIAEMERQPIEFFVRRHLDRVEAARHRVAAFVGADPAGLVLVRNASEGVNAVLRSLRFAPGDEILVTNHGYGACRHTAHHVVERAGGQLVTAHLPFIGLTPDRALEAIEAAVTARTRLALIDHITSPTGLVMPIDRIVAALEARGVPTLVDGAHGPGMVPLDLEALGAAWYVANLHKWVCAPKGAGFLYARADQRAGLHPAVISHGYAFPLIGTGRSRLHLEFDWIGTDDPSPWLCAPLALDVVGAMHPDGWPGLMARNRSVALAGRRRLAEALGVDLPVPDSMVGSLAALPLPPSGEPAPTSPLYTSALQADLLSRFAVEVPIVPWPAHPQRLVRASAAPYTTVAEWDHLAAALEALI